MAKFLSYLFLLLVTQISFASTQIFITDFYEVLQRNVVLTTSSSPSLITISQITLKNKRPQNASPKFYIKNQYIYSPYGIAKNLNHSDNIKGIFHDYSGLLNQCRMPLNITQNQFGYMGQITDSSTNLMMLGGFRNYAPNIGRFIQPDTYNSFSKDNIDNAETYASGNPLLFIDPSGHAKEGVIEKIITGLEKGINFPSPMNKLENADIEWLSTVVMAETIFPDFFAVNFEATEGEEMRYIYDFEDLHNRWRSTDDQDWMNNLPKFIKKRFNRRITVLDRTKLIMLRKVFGSDIAEYTFGFTPMEYTFSFTAGEYGRFNHMQARLEVANELPLHLLHYESLYPNRFCIDVGWRMGRNVPRSIADLENIGIATEEHRLMLEDIIHFLRSNEMKIDDIEFGGFLGDWYSGDWKAMSKWQEAHRQLLCKLVGADPGQEISRELRGKPRQVRIGNSRSLTIIATLISQ